VLPWELYVSLQETLEIVSDPQSMLALRRGIEQAAAGRTVAWERVKDQLVL
jgi:PHD/YefM family antitoxin component YafN of YafNO toxin-antitoxin module